MEPADALDTRQVQARKPPDRDAGTAPPFLRPGMAVRLQRGRVHRRVQRRSDPLPLPRQHHTDPLDPGTSPGLMTGGQDTWSARCVETRTAGAAGGPGKPTGSNPGRAPRSDPTSAPRSALAQRYFIQALALVGDAKACDRALAEAVREFERRRPDQDPDWIRYFNEAELDAEFGHCLR